MFRSRHLPRPVSHCQPVVEFQPVVDPDTGYVVRKPVDLSNVKLPDAKMTDLALQLKSGVPLDRVKVQKIVNEGMAKSYANELNSIKEINDAEQ